MIWYWFFIFCILLFGELRTWSLIAAAVLAIAGFFIHRRLKNNKLQQLATLHWILKRYSVEEGMLYQSEPKSWIYPEIRDLAFAESKAFEDLDAIRDSQIEQAKLEFQEENEKEKNPET